MLKHRYSFIYKIFNSRLCGFSEYIIRAFLYLLFEDFIYIQCWIDHISNCKLINTFLCIVQKNKVLRHMQ